MPIHPHDRETNGKFHTIGPNDSGHCHVCKSGGDVDICVTADKSVDWPKRDLYTIAVADTIADFLNGGRSYSGDFWVNLSDMVNENEEIT